MQPHSQPADLLVRGADRVVTMDDEERQFPGGWVGITDGVITGVGGPGTEPVAAREVIDAAGGLVTPGLINTHHHMFQNLTRSNPIALRGTFFDWLQTLYPMFTRLDSDAIYLSAWVGMAELALGGCTTSSDHLYAHPQPLLMDSEITAASDFGFRFHPTRGSMNLSDRDGGLPPQGVLQESDEILADCERLIARYHDPSPHSMLRVALGPAAAFAATPDLMLRTAELAERHDVRLHTHLAEDNLDTEYCLETYGCRPIEHFEAVGWGGDRSWVAHCIYPSVDEISRLAVWGTGVAHCPSAVQVLGGDRHNGITPVRTMLDRGVNVGIGCDGSASADHASMWLETKNAMVLARLREGTASAMPAYDALKMATRGSATCLGREGEIGVLAPGAAGDLVVWPMDTLPFAGAVADPVTALLQCGPTTSRHTVIAGHLVVRDGRVAAPELGDMLQQHRAAALYVQGITSAAERLAARR